MRRPLIPSLLLFALCATGCGGEETAAPSAEPATRDSAPQLRAAGVTGTPVSGVYEVDAAESEVYWLTGRAGTLARFSHSHTISAETFSGRVNVDADDVTRSTFELEFPVGELVVDDPDLRARLGEEFASVPSEEDKSGTRANMLGDALLDADMYPVITVRGTAPEADAGPAALPVEIEIAGGTFDYLLPGSIVFSDGSLEVGGEFALEHSELGLVPFTALGGAIQVAPTIQFVYRIRANRVAP